MNQHAVRTKGPDEKFCHECAEIIRARAEICPKCGVRQMESPNQYANQQLHQTVSSNGKIKLTAALLAIFLGGIGAHKFYLDKTMQGFIYLILCWTFIPAIIGLIEGLNFLSMKDSYFNRVYNTNFD